MISGPEDDPRVMRFGQNGVEPAANGAALTPLGLASQPRIPSDSCCLTDLLDQHYSVGEADRKALDLAGGWARRWTAKWKITLRPIVMLYSSTDSSTVAQPLTRTRREMTGARTGAARLTGPPVPSAQPQAPGMPGAGPGRWPARLP
jgi:hypothetical protein